MSDFHAQTMAPVSNVYTLPRCDIALYADSGAGVLGALVWRAQQVDDFQVAESFEEIETRATGIPWPDTHHSAERHELTFDGIWNVAGRMARNTEYILAITWQDAALDGVSRSWVRRFYQGVMTSSRKLNTRDANEFAAGLTLKAKYFVETSYFSATGTSAPPVTSARLVMAPNTAVSPGVVIPAGTGTPPEIGPGTATC